MLQYIYNKMFQEEIMKKLLSLLLAAIMLFTLGFSAVADENDDPTTYLSIMNNDYESVIMTFNVNADKFVADTATYRVFSDVCFEDVVSDQGGSAFVNIYFYDEGGKYIAHSDWASSFQPKGEDGEWNDCFWTKPSADSLDDLGAAEADSRFFTFIKRWLANRAVTLAQEEPLTPNYDINREPDWLRFFHYFSDKAKDYRYHSFATFREFCEAAYSKGYDIIGELTHTLSTISDPVTSPVIRKAYTAPWAPSSQKPWERNFEMRPMILFSAIAEFILSQPFDIARPRQVGEFDGLEFRRWTRMVHNVVENRNIDSERVQLATTRQLKDVLRLNDEPVYLRLLDYIDSSKGDSNREFREEAAKIQRIISDNGWQEKSTW